MTRIGPAAAFGGFLALALVGMALGPWWVYPLGAAVGAICGLIIRN